MKLRSILIILSLLVCFSTLVGGYIYLSSLHQSILKRAEQDSTQWMKHIQSEISTHIGKQRTVVKAIAGLKELVEALADPNPQNLAEVNFVLDNFKNSFGVSVCYLLDTKGSVLASSNRGDPDSFVGKNYGFRPYFKQALKGRLWVYLAQGVTSRKRGIYYSYPVTGETAAAVIGVVVIKDSVDGIEGGFRKIPEGIAVLMNPNGLWEPSTGLLGELKASRQFGGGPWNWLGFSKTQDKQVVDRSGKAYVFRTLDLGNQLGWQAVYIRSLDDMTYGTSMIRYDAARFIIPIIMVIGIIKKYTAEYLKRKK